MNRGNIVWCSKLADVCSCCQGYEFFQNGNDLREEQSAKWFCNTRGVGVGDEITYRRAIIHQHNCIHPLTSYVLHTPI